MVRNKKVLIIYKFLPQWRVDFFNKLKLKLNEEGIELKLVYGKLQGEVTKKNDEVTLEWGEYIPNKVLKLGKIELLWQPVFKEIRNADFVIVEQANKLLINYILIILKKIGKIKFAFWGHGLNLQDNPNSISNKFKKLYSNNANWWFAYTSKVKEQMESNGFSGNQITIVQNAIDTRSLMIIYNEISPKELRAHKTLYNIGAGPIGLFCGGIYKEKRIDFLIETCLRIKESIHNFEMILIGAGPEDYKVKIISETYEWIHYVGPKFGIERIPFFKLADVFLMPGLVGLAILDSFAMKTPIITTNFPYHSPEIEYLENGINGIMTENTLEVFSQNIISLLEDKNKMDALKKGCIETAKKYTLENMVNNFTDGVKRCLAI